MAKRSRTNQDGGSILGNIILIALFAYGVYLAFQYVPQLIESRSVDSILDSLQSQHRSHPYESAQAVEQALKSSLNMNQMDEMIKNFTIRDTGRGVSIEVHYERELNLLFQQKTITVNRTMDLD
ncbi:MAG TPA: DUF4845 domain-containing protein [Xanthomonadales bacterium]|nr:DUF4845 domain-containing protein [Xanthomonadales bacterium]